MASKINVMQDTLKIVGVQTLGFSDTVWLAIIAGLVTVMGGLVTLATILLNAKIAAAAEKAKTAAATEAAKIVETQKELGIKIDGRLTQLIESLEREGVLKELKAHQEGKEEGKKEEQEKAPPTSTTSIHEAGPVKLNITEGQIKVVPETTKKKPK